MARIALDGSPSRPELIEQRELVAEAVRDALADWRSMPTRKGGMGVAGLGAVSSVGSLYDCVVVSMSVSMNV